MRGVCLDAQNIPYGCPSPKQLAEFHAPPESGYRLVAFDTQQFYWYAKELTDYGHEIALVLTGQSFPEGVGSGDWDWYCERWATVMQPSVWILGNEFNVQHDATWPAGGDEVYVRFWNEAASAIRRADPNATLYLGGMFSEADTLGHLDRIWRRLDPTPDGANIHPYQETLGEAEQLLTTIRRRYGCQVGCFEWNDSNPDTLPAFARMLARTTDHDTYYAWSDGMLPEHGIVTGANRKKPVYHALRRAYGHA